MDKKISIALATYNGATYLQALLDSLAQQTYPPYELVVSDDNSSDDTLAIVERFAAQAPFEVKIVPNAKQLGIIENFATAFANTRGELIAYCDQDDIWAPEKLATCVRHFADPGVKLVMHRSEVVDGDLTPLGYCIPEQGTVEYGAVPFPSSWEMTYGLGHQMLFDARIYRDFAWIFRQGYAPLQPIADNYDIQFRFLAGLNGDIVSLADGLVKFRRHASATSDAGLADKKTATTSGFLGKSAGVYGDDAAEMLAIAEVFSRDIIDKMPQHKDKLTTYVDFLKRRASLYRLRGETYDHNPLWARCGAYLALLRRGAYAKKSRRGFGRKALLVDLFVAVLSLPGAQKVIASRS